MHRPGDVLAGRYRLADLLSESDRGRFWLAHDSVLGRPVAVHVLEEDDPRAPALMTAARISASIADRRLLRVLDAETREGISYVVNEWGRGTSLDILLARSGPVTPRRAAWITSQVASTLAKAHALGHAHGRLNPENILIDEAGAVRIIGFAVEAALYGQPPGTAADDNADLAAILGACLTGTWSGRTASALPPTPSVGGRPMRPRQVRAGVPRALDDLCETALNPDSRGRHEGPVIDARYLHDRLMEYLGDPSDVAGLPAERPGLSDTGAVGTVTTTLRVPPAGRATGGWLADGPPDADGADDADRGPGQADVPTQASLPSFEDDSSWHLPRTTPAPPPPPLAAPEPKPLFADEARGRSVGGFPDSSSGDAGMGTAPDPTTVSPGTHTGGTDASTGDVPENTGRSSSTTDTADEYFPWNGEPEPGRNRWLPFAVGLVVLILVVAAALVVRDLNSKGGGSGSGTQSASPTANAAPITELTATDFDPQGDPPSENPARAHLAVDGDPSTYWLTNTYKAQLGTKAPSLKSGVGLVVDLHGKYAVNTVHLTLNGSPTAVSLYLADDKPSDVAGLKPAATTTVTGDTGQVDLHGAHGRYLVVWLTSLPSVSGGYRGEIAEIAVTGSDD